MNENEKWYHFSVASLLEGSLIGDASFNELPGGVTPQTDCKHGLRNLGNGLFDYPSDGIWSGYVLASDRHHAEEIVQRRL